MMAASPDPEQNRMQLTRVDDVLGLDQGLRSGVSDSTAEVETASASLRRAIQELHEADDAAWRRYAADLESASLRLDAQLGIAAARLRAEQATSKQVIKDSLEEAGHLWRSRAEEIRVQTRLGQMDARDVGLHGLDDLDHAAHQVSELATSLLDDVGETLTSLRGRVRAVLDEISRQPSEPEEHRTAAPDSSR